MHKDTGYNWIEILVNGKIKCSCDSFEYSLPLETWDYMALKGMVFSGENISKSGRLIPVFVIWVASTSVNQMLAFLRYD